MEEELFIIDLVKYLWRKKIIIICAVIIGAILGFCYAKFMIKPEYSSSFTLKFDRNVTVFPENDEQIEIGDAITQGTALYEYEVYKNQNLISFYGELLKSRNIHEKIIKELELDENINNYDQFIENIQISYNQNNGIIKVTVKYNDAELASKIATMLYKISREEFEKIYGVQEIYTIAEPTVDEFPKTASKGTLTVLFGVLFGCVAIFALYITYYFDNTIKRPSIVTLITNYPVLATIYKNKDKNNNSQIIDNTKILRTQIEKIISKNAHKVVLVTSTKDGEGVSTSASNLAIVFANQGKKTVLVDANLRTGEIASLLDVENKIGLSEYLAKDIDEAKIITGTKYDKLSVVVSGEAPSNPSELLSNNKMAKIIEKLKEDYDIVIIDGSPLLDITDGLILVGISEEVLIVTSYKETKKDDLEMAKIALSNIGATNVSAVFNKYIK